MSKRDLVEVSEIVGDYMDRIVKLFKPGKKITVLVRTPGDDHGQFDFMMSDDDPQELLNMIARRKAAGENPTSTAVEVTLPGWLAKEKGLT